jgi:hypothetical protein
MRPEQGKLPARIFIPPALHKERCSPKAPTCRYRLLLVGVNLLREGARFARQVSLVAIPERTLAFPDLETALLNSRSRLDIWKDKQFYANRITR